VLDLFVSEILFLKSCFLFWSRSFFSPFRFKNLSSYNFFLIFFVPSSKPWENLSVLRSAKSEFFSPLPKPWENLSVLTSAKSDDFLGLTKTVGISLGFDECKK
jgi:hypothetical protein